MPRKLENECLSAVRIDERISENVQVVEVKVEELEEAERGECECFADADAAYIQMHVCFVRVRVCSVCESVSSWRADVDSVYETAPSDRASLARVSRLEN